ncbi:TOBE domain-containing protein [Campylobacter sp. MG1]|uniref:TOBE domain-containing protein n=1 Tax=Campylobacter sp. MG1 TaxID=2976332 RepID=UPI00226CCD00|nr:TOBE domain-containing protein [Campylobacter sp. MG1]
MLSARNILKVNIVDIKSDLITSLVYAKLENSKKIKALITTDSVKDLDLKSGDNAIMVFKANSVIISKNECAIRLSSANELHGKIINITNGAVYSIIDIDCNGIKITASITNESVKNMNLQISDSVNVLIKASNILVGIEE